MGPGVTSITLADIFSLVPTSASIIIKMDIQGYECKVRTYINNKAVLIENVRSFYFVSKVASIALIGKGQFWKGIGIQNFTSLSSYSFNRIGIIPYP